MIIDEWKNGVHIAKFSCNTDGPEGSWNVEMRLCDNGHGTKCRVISEPFSGRLMWFGNDHAGIVESNMAFCSLVSVAMCDSVEEDG